MDQVDVVEWTSTLSPPPFLIDEDDFYDFFDFLIKADDIWLLICSCVTVITHIILLCSIFKCNYRSSTYLLIAYYSFFDILQQPFSIAMFRLLFGIHKSFKSFRIFRIMMSIYLSLNCELTIILMLILLKNTVKFIERKLVYFMFGLWALVGFNIFIGYTLFYAPYAIETLTFIYVMYYNLLVVVIYVEQIIDTVKQGREHPPDYRAGLLIAQLFVAAKFLAAIVIIMIIVGKPSEINSLIGVLLEVMIGLTELCCILHVVILSYTNAEFKSNVLKILKLDFITNKGQIHFAQMPEENVNIVVDSS